jgi:CO dehydrogenase maturation factor
MTSSERGSERTVVAICGKGGVGKTTTCALLARLLTTTPRHREGKVLLVDGDPAGGLGMALGARPPRSLDDLRTEIIAELSEGSGQDQVDLAASTDYRLMELLEEHGNLAFLSVGRPEEEGCYCKLNTFLRAAIESLGASFDLTLVDAEAGVEQVNRRVMRSISHLLLVTDLSLKGLRVAESIHQVAAAGQASDYRVGLLINRARDSEQARRLAGETDLPLVATIPEDPMVTEFDGQARSFFELPSTSPALVAMENQLLGSGFLAENVR